MSISVSRESISKLMGELVDTFPIEAEGRSSISDFGKLLFTEGQSNGKNTVKMEKTTLSTQTGSKRVFTEIKGIPRQKQHDIRKTKNKAIPKRWTQDEDERLREAVGRHGERNWKSIAEEVPGRNHTQCLQRWTKVLAPGLVKGHWRPDEDELLKELVAEGRKNWGQVATRIPGRTSKQCRERWYNHLDPSIVRGEYTPEEDRMILDAQARLGNRWSAIAGMLPGRTEDAVKIRWKSLCRVRKGQGRRGQSDKGKMKGTMGMHRQLMQQGSRGFDSALVKSEEVAAFSMHPQQHGGHMIRLSNGQMVPAAPMQSNGQHGQHHDSAMMGGNAMMYSTGMSGEGYGPAPSHYRKPSMQQHMVNNSYDHAALSSSGHMTSSSAQDSSVERRSDMNYPVENRHNVEYSPVERRSDMDYSIERRTNMPSNGMPAPSPSPNGYRQGYPGSSSTYTSNMNGGMYPTGPSTPRGDMYPTGSSAPSGGMNNEQVYGNGTSQMDTYRSGALFSAPMSSHQPPQPMPHSSHSHLMPYNYGLPQCPSTAEDMKRESTTSHPMLSSNNGMNNPAAGYAQQQHHRQQESHEHADRSTPIPYHHAQQPHRPMQHDVRAHEQYQPSPEKEPSGPRQHHLKQSSTSEEQVKQEPRPGLVPTSSSHPTPNPAAMFARSQAAKASPAAGNGNPVAAFLQMQHHQKRKEQPNSANKMAQAGPQRPFNPAAAFAQRFQAGQRPPMPSSSSNAGSTKSNDDPVDDDDDSENGSASRSNEPSLKKIKPRLSIDAARASAARRMRNSGSGGNLAGRGSLDVFLNEIGDVGRLSDLKMDEFQTLDELWRVSGDMERLSL